MGHPMDSYWEDVRTESNRRWLRCRRLVIMLDDVPLSMLKGSDFPDLLALHGATPEAGFGSINLEAAMTHLEARAAQLGCQPVCGSNFADGAFCELSIDHEGPHKAR